jgi:hypothetical protein
MTVYICKAHKTIADGFTGELKRQSLIYDFAKDGGAYSGNSWVLGTISGNVLIEKIYARATAAVVGSSSTVSIGNTDSGTIYVSAEAEAHLGLNAVAAIETTAVPHVLTDGKQIILTIGTANLTAGQIVVEVYYKDARVG